jgi:methylenetetrahydrofolate dehydrogenase (NADP+)/methenyltetrahydrofolate cyclohydrolase
MIFLDGKSVAAAVREELRAEIAAFRPVAGRPPGLAVILAGEDAASLIYVRHKERACADTGVHSLVHRLPADIVQAELLALIAALNRRRDVDGILLQLPLPPALDARACLGAVDPRKDVDGFHPENMGRLALGLPGFVPCTPAGIMELLRRYNLSPAGKNAVIVGRSNIVGKPLALLLARREPCADATVTLCHTRTPDLAGHCRRADFLFVAAGRARCVTGDMVRKGAVVVDVGINRTKDGVCGDVDFAGAGASAAALTPVPGGVGPMTIAMLLKNTVRAWKEAAARS